MNIIIVDDDKLVTASLKIILENDPNIHISAVGFSGQEAVSLYSVYQPDVLLMDIRMDKMTGIDAAKEILAQYPQAKILFLTTFSDDEYIIQALRIGAKGYILKQDFDSILPALKSVQIGQSVFGEDIVQKIPTFMNKSSELDYAQFGISDKEKAIIKKVADGLSNKEIAEQLYLSEGTVRNYLSNILEKLELRDRTQFAIFYYKKAGI